MSCSLERTTAFNKLRNTDLFKLFKNKLTDGFRQKINNDGLDFDIVC